MAQTDYPGLLWDLITEVRDWSNRDSEVLSDSLINRCLEYAADTAYRDLHIPALERTARWTITDSDLVTGLAQTNTTPGQYVILRVPIDAVDFMHLRVEDTGVVFNEKVDDRTFFDIGAIKTSYNRFARIGDDLHIAGDFNVGSVILLHYRRRLPSLDARYTVNALNYPHLNNQGDRVYLINRGDRVDSDGTISANDTEFTSNTQRYRVDGQWVYPVKFITTAGDTEYYVGRQIPNWLRDDNKKVLVFGALYHAGNYLGDMDMMQRWGAAATQAVEELNREEKMRRASGGNVSVNYTSHLL